MSIRKIMYLTALLGIVVLSYPSERDAAFGNEMTAKKLSQNYRCHCEEPFDFAQDKLRDEAISRPRVGDCFAALAMTSQSAGFEMVSMVTRASCPCVARPSPR